MAINSRRIELITAASEIVGYKSGLTLARNRLIQFTPLHYINIVNGPDEESIRVRPEEFEEIIANILYQVGNISTPSITPFPVDLWHKYKGNPETLNIYQGVMSLFIDIIGKEIEKTKETDNKVIDPTVYVEECERQYGVFGARMAIETLANLNLQLHRSPWAPFRRIEWRDTLELNALFQSESLETYHGSFLDQRFIDYLSQNFSDIHKINWRKFEGLTCEFFERLGLHVEIGKGRDDDNIDARIWPTEETSNQPPTLLVQCKRQRRKIGKVVVKALWADIAQESAESGLIVTTSTLSPGAQKVCTARGYPIVQADRKTLQTWIKAMRTPTSGIILGE